MKGINRKKTLKKQKGGFNRILYEKIKGVDDPNDLACILKSDSTIQNLIIDYVWNLLKKLNTFDEKFDETVNKALKQVIDASGVIKQIGFNDSEIETIKRTVTENRQSDFISLAFLKTKIHATSTALSTLNGEYTQSLLIRNDEVLYAKIVGKIKKIFNLPRDFTLDNFKEIYETSNNDPNKKMSFDRLLIKTLHHADKKLSVVQLNFGRENFTRLDKKNEFVPEDITRCFEDIKEDENTKIYGVRNFLDISNTFTEAIFKKYGRNLIGGISGSTHYLYILITKLLKINVNKETLAKLLCITVMDYVPLWHSLEEILMTFSIEFEEFGLRSYKINEDPIAYFKYILKKNG